MDATNPKPKGNYHMQMYLSSIQHQKVTPINLFLISLKQVVLEYFKVFQVDTCVESIKNRNFCKKNER